MSFLLLYVDDIVLTASSQSFLHQIISGLRQEFSMTDMSPLHHFLGITVERRADGLFLSQRQYLLDILDRAGMRDCKPCSTPVDTHSKLSADGTLVSDPTHYRSIAGALQYLTFTRPDIAYAIQQICLYMHDPRDPHLAAMKRILRYRAAKISAFISTEVRRWISQFTQMLIGLDARILADLPPVMLSSLGTILSPGPPNAKRQYPVRVLKPSIAPWPMALLKLVGFVSF
jgi:hypothetical protein